MVDVQNRYRIYIILSAFFFIFSNDVFSQKTLNWNMLGKTIFESKLDSVSGLNFYYPDFGEQLTELDGDQVEIQGYILPLDPIQNYYILSKNPMASCFFCGKAGPETILELQLDPNNKRVYKMDEIVVFSGTFLLNLDDINHCNFILKNAKEIW